MPRVGKLCLRMVPRLVSVELSSAPTAEPLGFTTKARPDSRVGDLLPGLCSAVGRAIEETALVFGDKRLRNKVTLARSGIQGSAQIGVLSVPPSHRCPSCGAVTDIHEIRADMENIREYIFEYANKLGYSSEPGCDYEEEPDMVPPPATLSDKEVFEWWCDEHYKLYGVEPPPGNRCGVTEMRLNSPCTIRT